MAAHHVRERIAVRLVGGCGSMSFIPVVTKMKRPQSQSKHSEEPS